MAELTLRLFGVMRDYAVDGVVRLQVEEGASLQEVKEALGAALGVDASILDSVAFGDSRAVLGKEARVSGDTEWAVLPPVCGG